MLFRIKSTNSSNNFLGLHVFIPIVAVLVVCVTLYFCKAGRPDDDDELDYMVGPDGKFGKFLVLGTNNANFLLFLHSSCILHKNSRNYEL